MECDKELPSVLIASCTEKEPADIVKLIFGCDLLEPISIESGVEGFLWHINTKYYEADVILCTLANKGLVSQQLASSVQAVIIYFDSAKDEGLEDVNGWLPYLKEYEADIKLILCTRCEENPSTGVSKLKAQEWCVKEQFELVELEPEVDEEWELEQDFVETQGIKRVVQALHAHVWPNLTLKERTEPTSFENLLHGGRNSQESFDGLLLDGGANQEMENTVPNNLSRETIEDKIEELLGCRNDDDFSNLFSQLQVMKERVSSLPSDQRKVCAEQVVLAFWKAIHGSDEEIDLSGEDI